MASEMKRTLSTAAASILIFCGGLAVASTFKSEPVPAQAAEPPRTQQTQVQAPAQAPSFTEAVDALKKSEPVSLTIPAIGVKNATISPVGLNPDQTVEVPPLSKPDLIGWYKHRATPGETGGAVLLGHVDAYGKAAVFYKVHTMKQGDAISVKRKDGSTATFSVDEVERVDKDAFPTEKVYGETGGAELRLVTCGGAFDQATGHYEDNIIVYAHLTR